MTSQRTRPLLAALLVLLLAVAVAAKSPRRSPRAATTSVGRTANRPAKSAAATTRRGPPARQQRGDFDDDDEDEDDFLDDGLDLVPQDDEDVILDDDEPDDDFESKSRRRPLPSSRTARNTAARKRSPRSRYAEEEQYDDYEDDYRRPPSRKGPPRRAPPGSGRRPPGAVVPYGRGPPQSATFTRGIAALRSSLPDPEKLKAAALTSIKAAKETTSSLSSNLYRDIKGLTSSELEQVMLKSTRPDDTPVKGKHVERLVGVTYQISARYDIYDAVLRKLWAKMAEKDWRTTLKALYILHRFSSDGSPDHAPALKARLRELRRMRDPKRKDKYFNSKQLLAGETNAENIKFRAFLSRYAHYVIMRAQCFGGMFDEIGTLPKVDPKKKPPKPITSTCLRQEHLGAAEILLKAGLACQLKDGEECENTAIAVERVASDLIALTSATAVALNRALKEEDLKGADPVLLKKWCVFYKDELLPQTRAMVKKTSPKLDAFGLFLPSRMGTTVSRDLLDKGLSLEAKESKTDGPVIEDNDAGDEEGNDDLDEAAKDEEEEPKKPVPASSVATNEVPVVVAEEADALNEEYEYDDEEYYDDEDY